MGNTVGNSSGASQSSRSSSRSSRSSRPKVAMRQKIKEIFSNLDLKPRDYAFMTVFAITNPFAAAGGLLLGMTLTNYKKGDAVNTPKQSSSNEGKNSFFPSTKQE